MVLSLLGALLKPTTTTTPTAEVITNVSLLDTIEANLAEQLAGNDVELSISSVDGAGCSWRTTLNKMWLSEPTKCNLRTRARRYVAGRIIHHYEVWTRIIINEDQERSHHYNIPSKGKVTDFICRFSNSQQSFNGQVVAGEQWTKAWCWDSSQDGYVQCVEEKYDTIGPYRLGAV